MPVASNYTDSPSSKKYGLFSQKGNFVLRNNQAD